MSTSTWGAAHGNIIFSMWGSLCSIGDHHLRYLHRPMAGGSGD